MSRLTLLIVLVAVSGCGALATSPNWTGGGMAVTGPRRAALADQAETRERAKVLSEPDQIGARHVLVMHADSKAKPEGVERSREEAQSRARECLHKIRGGAELSEMVGEYSDEPGAGERDGDLGVFKREVMIKSFSDAAFDLRVGEISEVIETPYGFHIIQRTQ